MTREEIIEVISEDKMIPFIQSEQLAGIVDFVIKNYKPFLPTIKGWIARDEADRLGLYDQKPTRKKELGAFSGGVYSSWVIGDDWIGRFSLDQTAKTLFPNLCWTNEPIEVELIIKPGTPESTD
jgi:hypothetical protein